MKDIINDIQKKIEDKYIKPNLFLHPTLSVVATSAEQRSEDENSYITALKNAAQKYGAEIEFCEVDGTNAREARHIIENKVRWYDYDTGNGILVLPSYGDLNSKIYNTIPVNLDIDGANQESYMRLLEGDILAAPCTALACASILKEFFTVYRDERELKGQSVVIVNRSMRVGRPLAELCLQMNLTPTICHSYSRVTDVVDSNTCALVTAIGKPNYFTPNDFSWSYYSTYYPKLVIDVGMNIDENGKLVGDFNNLDADGEKIMHFVTPVLGGVGKLTTTFLMAKLFNNARKKFDASC